MGSKKPSRKGRIVKDRLFCRQIVLLSYPLINIKIVYAKVRKRKCLAKGCIITLFQMISLILWKANKRRLCITSKI